MPAGIQGNEAKYQENKEAKDDDETKEDEDKAEDVDAVERQRKKDKHQACAAANDDYEVDEDAVAGTSVWLAILIKSN
ncbi:hypothetical protein OS493_004835 [Desmophyllum pertusum]|uniref:Uncharacterized protein n=1 Tax=Desmophyllum pertusum TaxID=174260 RepID=A0A9W9Z3Q2_9CNID|nr:hypothetical protein OS493_004835 [Desmophyllum pertusum]